MPTYPFFFHTCYAVHLLYTLSTKHLTLLSRSMTNIPPPLLQPPHDHLAPLLGADPAQKPVAPLPHNMTRIVRVTWPAADLCAAETGVCGNFAREIERCGGGGEQRGSAAGGGERSGRA